ncbi:YfjI family protein [Planomonospora algeriensis]
MNTQITADEIVGTVIKSEPWEEPVPLGGRASLPAFPVEVLPGYIAEMVNGTAEEIQVPADLPGALALAVLATVVAGRAEVAVRGSWTEPLNLFVAVAMPPGSGKSPAFRMMLGPISEAERQLQATARTQIAEAEAERKSALANAEEARRKAKSPDEIRTANQALQAAETMEIPIMPRLTADDTTPEQATTTLTEQGGRLAILSAEGAFFEIVLGRYSSRPNVELLLKGHAGDRLQIDRRSRTEAVDRPALTIGLCVQPQMLQDIAAKPQMQGRGALARFLFSVPRDLIGNRKIEPETVSRRVIEEYGTRLTRMALDLTRRSGPPAVIGLTAGALRLHTEWRGEIEPRLRIGNGDLETLREWAAKLPGATARLAGLLHLAQDPDGGSTPPSVRRPCAGRSGSPGTTSNTPPPPSG